MWRKHIQNQEFLTTYPVLQVMLKHVLHIKNEYQHSERMWKVENLLTKAEKKSKTNNENIYGKRVGLSLPFTNNPEWKLPKLSKPKDTDWINKLKHKTYLFVAYKKYLTNKYRHRLKVKEWKKICHVIGKKKISRYYHSNISQNRL